MRAALLALCLVGGAMAFAPSASAITANYTFTGGAQGWTTAQSSAGPLAIPSYDPGGYIYGVDTGDDTGCPDDDPCEYFFFAGPPLVSTLGANYGGSISFDYSTSSYVPGATAILFIATSNRNAADLGYVFSIPGPGFQRITVPLTETGWRRCSVGPRVCAPATTAEFRTGLGAGVYTDILADTIRGTGETYALDNFSISEAPAPPSGKAKRCAKGKKAKKKSRKCKRKRKKKRLFRLSSLPHLG